MDAGRERRAVKKAMKDDREEESVRHVDGRFPEGRKMRGSRSVDDRLADVTLCETGGRGIGIGAGIGTVMAKGSAMTGRGVVGAGKLEAPASGWRPVFSLNLVYQ